MGVRQLISAEDMSDELCDERSIMTYLYGFRFYFDKPPAIDDRLRDEAIRREKARLEQEELSKKLGQAAAGTMLRRRRRATVLQKQKRQNASQAQHSSSSKLWLEQSRVASAPKAYNSSSLKQKRLRAALPKPQSASASRLRPTMPVCLDLRF